MNICRLFREARSLARDVELLFAVAAEQDWARAQEWGRVSAPARRIDARVVNAVLLQRLYTAFALGKHSKVLWIYSNSFPFRSFRAATHGDYIYYEVGVDQVLDKPALLRSLAVDVVIGYPYDLRLLAGCAPKRVELAMSYGDILDAATRKIIERDLADAVCDIYCASEIVGPIAWSCPVSADFHVNSDYFAVEFEPLQEGLASVRISNNLTGSTSFESGDVVRLSEGGCVCGRGLPTVASLEGRLRDCILVSAGGLVTPKMLLDHLGLSLGDAAVRFEGATSDRPTLLLSSQVADDVALYAHRLEELLQTPVATKLSTNTSERNHRGKMSIVRYCRPAGGCEVLSSS